MATHNTGLLGLATQALAVMPIDEGGELSNIFYCFEKGEEIPSDGEMRMFLLRLRFSHDAELQELWESAEEWLNEDSDMFVGGVTVLHR